MVRYLCATSGVSRMGLVLASSLVDTRMKVIKGVKQYAIVVNQKELDVLSALTGFCSVGHTRRETGTNMHECLREHRDKTGHEVLKRADDRAIDLQDNIWPS